MKNNSTKKSLKASALSLMLCLAMLIGTTFAWFTDSITNSGNKIQAGNLKIDAMAYDTGVGGMNVTIKGVNGGNPINFEKTGQNLKEDNTPIISEELFEPGKSNAKLLQVTNNGNLAAKIKLDFKVSDNGLMNSLWFDFVKVDENGVIGTFDKKPMSQLDKIGKSIELPLLNQNENVKFVLIYGMNDNADNSAQGKSFTADVSIVAKQEVKENDGFGNPNYDKDAQYATPVFTSKEFEDAAKKGGIVELKNNITLDKEYLDVKKDLTIVGNGNTLKAPTNGDKKDRVINVSNTTDPVTLTLKNVNIDGPKTGSYNRGVSFYNTQGGLNLVMDNCSVSTNYYAINVASECKDVNVTIRNSTLTGYAAFQTHSPDAKIRFDNCVLIGDNIYPKNESNNFAAIVINKPAGNTKLVFNDCTIKVNRPTGNKEYYLDLRSDNNKVQLNNCKFVADGKEQTVEEALPNIHLYTTNNSIMVDGVEVVQQQ